MKTWFLEGRIDGLTTTRKLAIDPLPFVIGRKSDLPLSIHSANISRIHAKIFKKNGSLFLKDLKSTNGSFLNRKSVQGEVLLKPGDILHIADIALKLTFESTSQVVGSVSTELDIAGSTDKLPVGILEFEAMLSSQSVTSVFQAIYACDADRIFAFEILGRGAYAKLPKSPGPLFKMAENFDREIALVELFREDGVRQANASGIRSPFFINIHPRELEQADRLLATIRAACEAFPVLHLVLEIHEGAVTDLSVMKQMRRGLNQLGVGLAYDDFGAGQTRLLELSEVPPDYLKFDIRLIKDIDQSPARQEMLAFLLQLSKNLKIKTLAEGISNEKEAKVCRTLGFDLFQGFYYGRPIPLPAKN